MLLITSSARLLFAKISTRVGYCLKLESSVRPLGETVEVGN